MQKFMNRFLGSAIAATLVLGAVAPAMADVDINVAIKGEVAPGVYGRVDLGGRPPPRLVYEKPVIIERPARGPVVEPVYLHVPPGHAKNWRKHCHEYHACNRPVYFIRSQEYEPGYHRR